MFSNNSVKLVTLKNRFLMTAKAVHSIRMCLTVQVVWQVKHCGCGSCFSMKAWVSLVWPMRSRDITSCSHLFHFYNAKSKVLAIFLYVLFCFFSKCISSERSTLCHGNYPLPLIVSLLLVRWHVVNCLTPCFNRQSHRWTFIFVEYANLLLTTLLSNQNHFEY